MDEKKKLIIIGVLTAVMLSIGAFQVIKSTSGHPAAPAATTADASKAKADPAPSADGTAGDPKDASQPEQKNDLVKGAYAERDPFKPLIDQNAQPATATNNLTPNPAKPLTERVARNEVLPPFPIQKGGSLPIASANGGTTSPVNPPAPQFGYKLAGVIVGRRPAAVFIDAQGAQHLVQLGGALDGDTRLVDLDKDHVVLRVKDQYKNLTLGGGNSSAK